VRCTGGIAPSGLQYIEHEKGDLAMYRKIIVPVDMGQLEKGENILAKAITLLDTGGEIILMSVVESVPPISRSNCPWISSTSR
jgi:hypothetical protein